MNILPIKIELISKWMKLYPYSVCLDEIYFRERDNNGNLVYELVLSTHQFEFIINHYYSNFRELNPESLIYKYHIKGYENWNDSESKEEECNRVKEFYEQLINIKEKVVQETSDAIEALNELLKICESVMKNKNKFYSFSDY
ncbi:hypothetical protein [Flavobacterium saccharophilum]|uniref:Uncharacterized protein n=1 Tax=Flavobacterium saccharophilum TaxID=29534 RepID=A0A1M7ATP3_9FLAO|nr:hypothetical protein [Flavobacterium saccharophilum]SHL46104.1 hypothetical protein SAMN05444366_0804 [Flavobacterium saccharophilum]